MYFEQMLEQKSASISKELGSTVATSEARSHSLAMKIASAQRAAQDINENRRIADLALQVIAVRYIDGLSVQLILVYPT